MKTLTIYHNAIWKHNKKYKFLIYVLYIDMVLQIYNFCCRRIVLHWTKWIIRSIKPLTYWITNNNSNHLIDIFTNSISAIPHEKWLSLISICHVRRVWYRFLMCFFFRDEIEWNNNLASRNNKYFICSLRQLTNN